MPEVTGKEYLHYFMERRLLKKRHRNFRRKVES
jgi:hypothetical protein